MREIRVKWFDFGVALLWAVAAALFVVEQLDGRLGILSLWVMLAVNAAVTMTLINWASQRIGELDPKESARLDAIQRGLHVLNGQRGPHEKV